MISGDWRRDLSTYQPTYSRKRKRVGRPVIERRQFSGGMKGKNLRYLNDNPNKGTSAVRVGFLLLEHFSLPAFTQVLDTVITAM